MVNWNYDINIYDSVVALAPILYQGRVSAALDRVSLTVWHRHSRRPNASVCMETNLSTKINEMLEMRRTNARALGSALSRVCLCV